MIQLKDYQRRVLDSLREFLRICARDRQPGTAFQEVIRKNGAPLAPYVPVNAEGLDPGMPYVCLRVPTGGGKTLLACYAAGIAVKDFRQDERGVVLWLVPSNTILDQTADALRDLRHPYRRVLEVACGTVEVVTIEEALRLSRATVDGQTVVIVATIQAFRVEDTTGRKVYAPNGSFAEHLLNVPHTELSTLLPGADGGPIPSLVNMLRLRRPVVIVDEAHNARTDLSFVTLGSVRPSCIIEFSATPARAGNPSNILHRVSAAELKAASMVKLPLRVISRKPSQGDQILAEAIALRQDLERLADMEGQQTGEYIRPILLIQAPRVDACVPLRERIVSEYGVNRDAIKISVGSNDELKAIRNISSPESDVRVIITVEKLREGWDCPFAYVLCSLKETRSATAIEQIVGRILRLPNARDKQKPDLNCGYVLSLSPSVLEVLTELREALESNGFTATEASRIILPVQQGTLALGSQPQVVKLEPGTEFDAAAAGAADFAGKVQINHSNGEVTVLVPLSDAETERLSSLGKTAASKERLRAAAATVRAADIAGGGTGEPRIPTGFERGVDFIVPRLSVREGPLLLEFEATHLVEHPWQLSTKDASLPPTYDPRVRAVGEFGQVDVAATGRVETAIVAPRSENDFVANLHQQILRLGVGSSWTEAELVAWLDHRIEHSDIPIGESAAFLGAAIRGLMTRLGISDIGILALDRFRLCDQIETRISEHRAAERTAAFNGYLAFGSPLVADGSNAINFRTMLYEPSWLYEGAFRFQRHYFPPRPGELAERTPNGNETQEFRCAQHLDGMEEVEFWIRNLSRKPSSFRLQTSSDWFYPDFVCKLRDGRILVVEYKGENYYTADDAREKRVVGEVWASRSGGRGVFVMPTAGRMDAIAEAVRRRT